MRVTQHALQAYLAKYQLIVLFTWSTEDVQKATEGARVLPGRPESGSVLELYFSKHLRSLLLIACRLVMVTITFRQGS